MIQRPRTVWVTRLITIVTRVPRCRCCTRRVRLKTFKITGYQSRHRNRADSPPVSRMRLMSFRTRRRASVSIHSAVTVTAAAAAVYPRGIFLRNVNIDSRARLRYRVASRVVPRNDGPYSATRTNRLRAVHTASGRRGAFKNNP